MGGTRNCGPISIFNTVDHRTKNYMSDKIQQYLCQIFYEYHYLVISNMRLSDSRKGTLYGNYDQLWTDRKQILQYHLCIQKQYLCQILYEYLYLVMRNMRLSDFRKGTLYGSYGQLWTYSEN